uniref:Uncharacterized protein n=1 Tax=Cacopsylla melanoneura TaxID=428564 RepID=A0A8D8V166_9HEMI
MNILENVEQTGIVFDVSENKFLVCCIGKVFIQQRGKYLTCCRHMDSGCMIVLLVDNKCDVTQLFIVQNEIGNGFKVFLLVHDILLDFRHCESETAILCLG